MLDFIASFNPIERLLGLLHSARRAPGLRGQHKGRIVGVRQISWPRNCGIAPVEIEKLLKRYHIEVSNRKHTDTEIMCDVSAARYGHAVYLVGKLLAGETPRQWQDGPRPQRRGPMALFRKWW